MADTIHDVIKDISLETVTFLTRFVKEAMPALLRAGIDPHFPREHTESAAHRAI